MAEINFRKRGDKWEYRFEGAKIDGKRKQISKGGFSTKKEATIAGTKAYNEYNNAGVKHEPSEISVADYLNYWFDEYVRMNLKYTTQLGYIQIIENHLVPRFGQYKLKSLNASAIQEYANDLKVKGLAKSTLTGIIATLSGALSYAVEPLHYIPFNPCERIRLPKYTGGKKETRFIISIEDFNRIIDRFDEKTAFYIPLMIGYYTGLRINEVFGLTWDDIDFEKRELHVNKIMVKRNYNEDIRKVLDKNKQREKKTSWYFGTPKTLSSIRVVKFGDNLYKALKRAKASQMENEMLYGEYYNKVYKKAEIDEKGDTVYKIMEVSKSIPVNLEEARLICRKENGELVSSDSFKYCARIIHHEMHIAFNFHSLRHTHATMLIENGANIKDVQARLGHESIRTTLETYTHVTEKMQNESVEIFDKATSKIG